MQAIILSGGLGSRLHPLTIDTPKPMLPINGVPHLEYQIRLLKKHGITDIIFSTGYLHEKIEEYFGNGDKFGVRIRYREDGEIPLGTAGAVKNCIDLVEYDSVLVMNGDILTDIDISGVVKTHKSYRQPITMALIEVENPNDFGIVQYNLSNGRITGFIEKPAKEHAIGNTINSGIYCLSIEVLLNVEEKVYAMLESDIFPRFAKASMMQAHICSHFDSKWLDIGTLVRYNQAQSLELSF